MGQFVDQIQTLLVWGLRIPVLALLALHRRLLGPSLLLRLLGCQRRVPRPAELPPRLELDVLSSLVASEAGEEPAQVALTFALLDLLPIDCGELAEQLLLPVSQ